MKKTVFWICTIIVMVIAAYAFFMWASYIDESITEGPGYGFNIGSSKEEILKIADDLYRDKQITLGYNIYDIDDPRNKPLNLKKDITLFFDKDDWRFYFGHRNFIALYFENNSLIEIYRHRQYFELP